MGSQYERVLEMRRRWAPRDEEGLGTYTVDPPDTFVRRHPVSSTEANGIRYQRCGGGYRVIRKRIGSN